MDKTGFSKITLPLERNLFNELLNTIDFEDVAKGRIGNHLVDVVEERVPIVRTTTKFTIPARSFSSVHHKLVAEIKRAFAENNDFSELDFNNALIEVYDRNYTKMKYHSDHCLDLEEGSYIGLFSCYENPVELAEKQVRKLRVKDKTTNEEIEIALTHNSLILFSLETNTAFLHKIFLDTSSNQKQEESDNRWLGITFRKSKTLIQFKEDLPYFLDGQPLTLGNENQKTEFYQLRGEENRSMDFIYPKLTYTLNIADTMLPKKDRKS